MPQRLWQIVQHMDNLGILRSLGMDMHSQDMADVAEAALEGEERCVRDAVTAHV
jgi:hypothetical protein